MGKLTYSHGLLTRTFDGPYSFEGFGDGPQVRSEDRWKFTVDLRRVGAWHLRPQPERLYSTNDLAEKYLRWLVEMTYPVSG